MLEYIMVPRGYFSRLIDQFQIEEVICNEDYEPYATERDKKVKIFLNKKS